ncbi:MAG: hypothetical protein IJA39_01870 [Clostridia bacterium]|nr:hypothetical protein [Clostridia bacterium]
MDIMDLASKGIIKITKNYGKKVQAKATAHPIPDVMPTTISGDCFRAGFAKAEIMPDLSLDRTYWIAGHGSGHKMEGILSPVYIHAMWLDCGNDEGIIWISADIVGLTNIEVNKIRKMILARPEMKNCKAINFSCTHSHSGVDTLGYWGKANLVSIPSDGKVPEYMEMLFKKAVKVSAEAYNNRKEGKLYSGRVHIENGLSTGRRLPERHEYLTRLRFVPNEGDEIWLMNIGAHPNSLGGGNRLLSGEYPYFMREQIKAEKGAEVIFGIGAIGGMDAKDFGNEDRVEEIKLQAKYYAEKSYEIENEKEMSPEIKFICQQFYLPVDNNVLTLLAIRGTMSFKAYPSNISETGIAMMTEITYMTIGSQKLLTLPGENFVSTVYGGFMDEENSTTGLPASVNAKPLADIAGDHEMIVFGVTNDMAGYCVPKNDFVLHPTQPYLNSTRDRFDENHYHETNSMGPETHRIIAEAFEKVVKNFNK